METGVRFGVFALFAGTLMQEKKIVEPRKKEAQTHYSALILLILRLDMNIE